MDSISISSPMIKKSSGSRGIGVDPLNLCDRMRVLLKTIYNINLFDIFCQMLNILSNLSIFFIYLYLFWLKKKIQQPFELSLTFPLL